jgi:hypothetical protein
MAYKSNTDIYVPVDSQKYNKVLLQRTYDEKAKEE